MPRLLVVDADTAVQELFRSVFEPRGMQVAIAASSAEASAAAKAAAPDVALLDVSLPDGSGLELFHQLKKGDPKLPVIMMTADGGSDTAIRAIGMGAWDYLIKPLGVDELRELIERALLIRRLMSEPVHLDAPADGEVASDALIGRCAAMQSVYKAIGRVAAQHVTVLIRGESGTGKELVARALYQHSLRQKRPFLAVNCAAIPEALLESELFGHEKGAFTGADKKRIGKFEQCNRGTLFLDEIGDMDAVLQSKLLRVLQEHTFERVGGSELIRADVRVISATNRHLEKMVSESKFREDLYYRLNDYSIEIPPLRRRGEDLPLLVQHFRRLANRSLGKQVLRVADDAMQALRDFDWPGNVRQLQAVVRQGVLQTTGPVLLAAFLPESIRRGGAASGVPSAEDNDLHNQIESGLATGSRTLYDDVIAGAERQLITRVLQHTVGNQSDAAAILGITRTTLRAKIEKLGITIERIVQSERG